MSRLWNKLKARAPKGVLFYLLGFYVILQFSWWAYMLVNLNAEVYELKLELLQLSGLAIPEQQILKADLDQKLSLRIWMVLGEGAVFVTILIFGFLAVRKSIDKELKLADQQKNFLLSVTHELRSPLAAVKLQLQTLNYRELAEDKRKQLYMRALGDTDRLEKLVENLLLVNKVESGKLPLDQDRIHLNDFLHTTLKRHYPDYVDSGVITFRSDEEIHLNADSMSLQSIFFNLIDNALKYGNGSQVTVELTQKNGKVKMRVSDLGEGIPDAEKEKVFERFYRVGNEEVRKTKGTGIGLYLVKLLVEQHNGTIEVSDNNPSGTVFSVTLPTTDR